MKINMQRMRIITIKKNDQIQKFLLGAANKYSLKMNRFMFISLRNKIADHALLIKIKIVKEAR